MEDLNSIVDDFFMETNQNRPTTIKKYDPNIHDYTKKKRIKKILISQLKKQEKQLKKQTNLGKIKLSKNTRKL